MEMKELIYEKGISIFLEQKISIKIDGILNIEMDDDGCLILKFENKISLRDNGESIIVFIDRNEASKGNYCTSIYKKDIYAIWLGTENLWQKWKEEEKKNQPKKTFFDTIIEFARKIWK